MIQITCTHCQARFNLYEHAADTKCPRCGRTVPVPPATAATKARTPLMPHAQSRARCEEEDIPLADEPSRAGGGGTPRPAQPPRPPAGQVIRPALTVDGNERDEIPLAEEPGASAKETPPDEPEPPPTPAGLIIVPAGDAIVVSFQSEKILDALTIETIGQELYALVDQRGCRKIVLDFGHVQFLSSQMLGVLIALHKKAAGIKGRLLLCAVAASLQRIFQLVKLDRMLPIVADRPTALGVLSLP